MTKEITEIERLWDLNRRDPKVRELNKAIAIHERHVAPSVLFGDTVELNHRDVQILNKTGNLS